MNHTLSATLNRHLSLSAWLTLWLNRYAPLRCAATTIERYDKLAGYIARQPTPEIALVAQTPIAELNHVDLELAFLSMEKMPAKRRARLSGRTIRHVAGVVRAALEKAFKLSLIDSNPMKRVDLPRAVKWRARSLTSEEIQALIAWLDGDDWSGCFATLAVATGCRRGELLALEWTDIDWRTNRLSITKSVEQTRHGLRIKSTKSGHERACTLPQCAIARLARFRDRSQSGSKLIFPDGSGGLRKPDLVSQLVVRRLRAAGVQSASLHTLRHTHATQLLSRGVPLPAISARLGHSDTDITARLYLHALPLDDQRIADEWDAFILQS